MKICVVGNILKDVYLNLNTRTNQFESDQNHIKWLNLAFDASEHHFFSRTDSLGGAAISLEVLAKMGLSCEVLGTDLHLEDDGLALTTPTEIYRYILIADGAVSYLVPDQPAKTTFSSPVEPVDYLYLDRSAVLTPEAVSGIEAYLDISQQTHLVLYIKDASDPCYTKLIPRADLLIVEENPRTSGSFTNLPKEKVVHLSEPGLSYLDIHLPLATERADMLTHLSLFSIAAATILGGFIQERSAEDTLALAAINVENSRLNATLPLSEMERIAADQRANHAESTPTSNLELIAANLMLAGKGILAADESGGSIKRKFTQLNIPDTLENRRDYRNIFFTTPHLEDFVNGVILFDETTKQFADNGQNFVDFLTAHQIIPGIKVDQGLATFDSSIETYTKGLEGLGGRLTEYYNRGLRFAKWRAAFEIRVSNGGEMITPTDFAIDQNCQILANYALECQKAGLVPIVEPEVVYSGYYSLDQNASVTGRILDTLFRQLAFTGVNLKACILKVNMVLAGKYYGTVTPDEVGKATARVLKDHVPADLAGVVFLSGGQTVEQATDNLAAICSEGPFSWPLTFSFARALQDPALYVWQGDNANADAARTAFRERLKANVAAIKHQNTN